MAGTGFRNLGALAAPSNHLKDIPASQLTVPPTLRNNTLELALPQDIKLEKMASTDAQPMPRELMVTPAKDRDMMDLGVPSLPRQNGFSGT